jgi:uncharacterized protein with von Willebrand factor type A (vWA) domain
LPLEGLYLHLVRRGFSISVRDYQDALLALRRGYAAPCREELRWLCETLWVRSEEEASWFRRLFHEFPWPSVDQVRELSGNSRAPATDTERGTSGARPKASAVASPAREQAAAVEFASPSKSSVGLPRAVAPEATREAFIMTPRPLVGLRSLIIALRRFRVAQRSGPRVELDIDATVAEQCRRGTLLAPVLLPTRRNLASLVILVDASPSMVTWRHMNALLHEALGNSHLSNTGLYFFDNVPGDELYEMETLSRAIPTARVCENHPNAAVLIVGDAGAARGRFSRERPPHVRSFLRATRKAWHLVAALNPMPRARWQGTTAAQIAKLLPMFQLNEDGLIRAVDYLRGKLVV